LTQETTQKPVAEINARDEPKRKPATAQELVESLKAVADDIGQISELSSEEKNLVTQFFSSLLKLMRPLTTAIQVNTAALPLQVGNVSEAYLDPTGHLSLMFQDGHMELKNLDDTQNRDLMISIVEDIVPKFKTLTAQQRRRIENRIKFMSTVTKEVQKISDTLPSTLNP
jgi:hypothetical protein